MAIVWKRPDETKLALLIPFAFLTACTVAVSTANYPPFVKAAQRGNIAEADRLMRTGELIDQKSIGNQTALHVAAAEGQDPMVLWLLSHEADPLAQDLNGKTPADFAREQGKLHSEELIQNQTQQYLREETAIRAGDKSALRELLANDTRRYTLLHVFAQLAATEAAIQEIEAGSDVNARTVVEMSPLHKSIVGGQLEIVRALIKAGSDVNARDIYNNTPLYYASFSGRKDIVNLLLASGADKSIRSVWGNESPIELTKRLGKHDVIPLLEK